MTLSSMKRRLRMAYLRSVPPAFRVRPRIVWNLSQSPSQESRTLASGAEGAARSMNSLVIRFTLSRGNRLKMPYEEGSLFDPGSARSADFLRHDSKDTTSGDTSQRTGSKLSGSANPVMMNTGLEVNTNGGC